MSAPDIQKLKQIANQIRKDIIVETHAAGSGHPGGSLSSTDLATVLYFHVINHRPDDPDWPDRDRVFWSKGHCSPVVYACLARAGYFDPELLVTFRKMGSILQGHPARIKTPGVETNGGSLGQGLSVALGSALGLRMDGKSARCYAFVGDGEAQEGAIWEAAMAAAHFGVDNLCVILDYNDLQIDGRVSEIMDIAPAAAKWRAFGWHVIELDGHDMEAILAAFEEAAATKGQPTVLVARTIKGKGVSFMEDKCEWHGTAPNDEQAEQALAELEAAL
jgi:transketolase